MSSDCEIDSDKGLLDVSLCIAVLHVALEVRVTFRFIRFPVVDIGMDTLLIEVVLRVTEPKAVREVVTAPTVPVDGDTVKLLDMSSDREIDSDKEVLIEALNAPKAVREVVTAPTVPVDGDTVKLLDMSSDREIDSDKEVLIEALNDPLGVYV